MMLLNVGMYAWGHTLDKRVAHLFLSVKAANAMPVRPPFPERLSLIWYGKCSQKTRNG